MLELIIHPGPKTEFIESPIPVPNDDQVVIKVIVSGSNPKDWKRPEWLDVHINQGDDIAGIVHQVGKNVTEFKVCSWNRLLSQGKMNTEDHSLAIEWLHSMKSWDLEAVMQSMH